MSYCRICGDERGTEYRERSGMVLCKSCHREAPGKVCRAAFDQLYWPGASDDYRSPDYVPESTRREFFDDYLASKCRSVEEYLRQTTSSV
jgi:hypothetical protein